MPPETLSAAVAAAPALDPVAAVRLLLFFGLLIGCMYTDLTNGKVYNVVTLPTIGVGLLLHLLQGRGDLAPLGAALLSSLFCFLIFFFIWAIGALSGKPLMGGGDVKLMAAIGALVPFPFAMWVMWYAIVVAGVMAVWVLFRHGEVWAGLVGSFRRLVWPSHPSEVSAAEKRATSRTISFCTAICVGGMLTFLFHSGMYY